MLLVMVSLPLCLIPETLTATEDRCDAARRELIKNKEELTEYVDALNKSHAKNDYAFMDILNSKINELISRTRELEKELAGCPEPKPPLAGQQGMTGVKSDDELMAEKSCPELKKTLVPVIRKINGLKRREKSLLSGLSPEEKSELAKAETELRIVKENLKKKCSGSEPAGSLQKRLRR